MDTKKRLNREAMLGTLVHAKVMIDCVIEKIQSGELDDYEAMAMSHEFSPILRQLCLAWHSKWMTEKDIETGGQSLHDRMASLVPNWGLNFDRLVDVDEPPEFDRRDLSW